MKPFCTAYSMIAIGGSHLRGNLVGEDFSFINQLTKHTGYKCLAKINNELLKDPAISVQTQINNFNPDIILIQPKDENIYPALKVFKNALLYFIAVRFIFPLLWIVQRRKSFIHFRKLKQVVEDNPRKYFIVISPVPCGNEFVNKFRQANGKLLKKLFGGCTNVTYMNLSDSKLNKKEYFAETYQLNRSGHFLLAKMIAKKSGLGFFSPSGNFAA
jgi:hypothetical protein